MPVPIAVEPWVEYVEVMSTRPRSTFLATLAAAAFAFFCAGDKVGDENDGGLIEKLGKPELPPEGKVNRP